MNDLPAADRLPRFYHDGPLSPGAQIELSERTARHVQALRLRVDERITLFNGDGTQWEATLSRLGKRGALAGVVRQHHVDREAPLQVHLLQGACASDRMDLVLQKATEWGGASVQPVVTARSVVRLSSEREARGHIHWQNVVIAACEQGGRNRIPTVAPSLPLADLLGALQTGGERLLLAPEGDTHLRALPAPDRVTLLIGPEGGLAPDEREMALNAGFTAVRFGPRILRTATAPLAAIAAIQALWGDC